MVIYRKSHLVQGKLTSASYLVRAKGIGSPEPAGAHLGEWLA